MNEARQQLHAELVSFLRTIQRPGMPVENFAVNDSLVASGLIDSLDTLRIVMHLETTYNINFSSQGIDPERLASIAGILDLIEESRT